MGKFLLIIFIFFSAFSSSNAQEFQSAQENFKLVKITGNLHYPWGMAFFPSGDILITEKRKAQLRLVQKGKLHPTPIKGLPKNITTKGQGGLLDVLIDPHFHDNSYIYLSYSGKGKGGTGTEVVRGQLINHQLKNLKVIFKALPKVNNHYHFGSRLLFVDNTLIISLGERFSLMNEAQNLKNHLGSIIRINLDGSIPKNNAFANHKNFMPEILSYGHRNVQGLALHDQGDLWAHEHGPRGGDEVNIIKSGRNYGWPKITYGIDYSGSIISDKTHMPGMEQPIVYWDPSIAPSGMTFYNGFGSQKFPNWQGDLFIGALAGQHLRRLEIKGNKITEQEVLLEGFARIRDVRSAPDGYLYFLTDENDGGLYRLEPLK